MRRLDVGATLQQNPGAPVALLAIGIWALWAQLSGGIEPGRWGPLGAVLVVLAALVIASRRGRISPLDRVRRVMFGALVAFVAWSFLSMLWADFPADAWRGSSKTLAYAASFAVFALWPWTPKGKAAMLGLFAVSVGVVAVLTLVRANIDPAEAFLSAPANSPGHFEGRLVGPTSYVNASVCYWMLGLWPALYLASAQAIHPWVRAVFLGLATLLLELAFLGQSRGWVILLPIALGLWLLLARERARSLFAAAVAVACAFATLPELLGVYGAALGGRPLGAPVTDATIAIGLSIVVAAAVGLAWERLQVSSLSERATAGLALGAILCLVAFGGTRAGVLLGPPSDWLDAGGPASRSRLGDSLESDRYQKWRIASAEFLDHPAIGIGTDNFAAPYLARRTNNIEEALYPHSIPLRLLSQVGLIGTMLFACAVGLGIALALRARGTPDAMPGGAAAAALTVFCYWLMHGSVDVFWEVPATAAPAFGMIGLAGAPAVPSGALAQPARQEHRRTPWLTATLAAATLVAAAALVLPWLATSYAEAGARVWRAEHELAYARFDRAAQLNPLDPMPYLLEGSIALRRGEPDRAREALGQAIARTPKSWYAHLQLALLAGSVRDYDEATAQVTAALALNPRDPILRIVEWQLQDRAPIDPGKVNALYERFVNLADLESIVRRYYPAYVDRLHDS